MAALRPQQVQKPSKTRKSLVFAPEINIFLPKVKKVPKRVTFWHFFDPPGPGPLSGRVLAGRPLVLG